MAFQISRSAALVHQMEREQARSGRDREAKSVRGARGGRSGSEDRDVAKVEDQSSQAAKRNHNSLRQGYS